MSYLFQVNDLLFWLLNGWHSPFWDAIMVPVTTKWTWMPIYALWFGYIGRRYGWRQLGWVLLGTSLSILLIDQLTSTLLKPWIGHLRPCRVEAWQEILHNPVGCASRYGFPSSHAANTFGFSIFWHKWLQLRKSGPWILYSHAALVSYSRIYVGVHCPLDVVGGVSIGLVLGYTVYKIQKWLKNKLKPQRA